MTDRSSGAVRPSLWSALSSVLRTMTLRWQLVLAFLLVSAVPVLVASLIAANIIAEAFADNVELWLQDAAQFAGQMVPYDEEEAQQAAGIIANTLAIESREPDEVLLTLPADLLKSVGYEVMAVYTADGRLLFAQGALEDTSWLPRSQDSGFYTTTHEGEQILLLGASRMFRRGDSKYFVFVADRWDGPVEQVSGAVPSLQMSILAPGEWSRLPPGVIDRLSAGEPATLAKSDANDSIDTAFAALRNRDGRLVGVIACHLGRPFSLMSLLRTLPLFLPLSAAAGLFSLLVALSVSKVISRPLAKLSKGLRQVHEGDYAARVDVDGGRELSELAAGFNEMAERLEVLRARETEVRRRQQLAILGEAAAVLAHEIRNPLGIIKTSSQVLRLKAQLPDSADRLVGFVLDEVGRIDNLVHDLLDFARPRTMSRRPVDVGAVLADVLDRATPDLTAHGIVVELVRPSGPAEVEGDAEQLRQCLLNLVLNAMDAMPGGGTLSTKVEQDGAGISVCVRDSGMGIPDEIRERLFEPFVTSKPRGTGLGLARVRYVVEQHGGSIDVETGHGQGTLFLIRFPARKVTGGGAV
ncbi:sensor histidine kinase [Oleisolibacter albus]|uniref:sensor histidine kinase n=1 Tax=Oleisolibacter albus TaxID=2171757 RepID=UPI00138FB994|nr:HAMP domain-containing sensor histidine kinase [Oleisolibacter albus]